MEEHLADLFRKYYQQTASDSEESELRDLLQTKENEELALQLSDAAWLELDKPDEAFSRPYQEGLSKILNAEQSAPEKSAVIHFRKRFWIAASILFLAAVGAWSWFHKERASPSHDVVAQKNSIRPGSTGAILTLSDGKEILLDQVNTGKLAEQNGTQLLMGEGELLYDPSAKGKDMVYNTISTPRGRQFLVVLGDRTRIWLNAESSVRFPVAFSEQERRVEVSGEAFFEVARNIKAPFKVIVNGLDELEVLGTSFNVEAYRNEEVMRTTLVEGGLRVTGSGRQVLLTPSLQAVSRPSEFLLNVVPVDISKVMAWKNGLFNFDGMSLKDAMKKLERWYDIDVQYETQIPEIHFFGKVPRNTGLTELLEGLTAAGIHFRQEGRKLIVTR